MPPGAIPFPFGDCRICNDRATGIHYGLATCEGCKGFFKRSIPKGDKYKCFFGGQCVITPQNRNRCKSCRYRKCQELGMSFEAVKMGRIPKIEKRKALTAARQMDNNWTDCLCTESPDSGIEEEVHKPMNWDLSSLGRDIAPVQQTGFFPHSLDLTHSRSGTAGSSAGFDNMCSLSSVPPQESEGRNTMILGFQGHEMNPEKIHTAMNPDRSETSNMNLLAETALFPDGSKTSPDESRSTDGHSSSGRSLYSPDVIKVLFNQVVEMTGSNKVPEMVMQKLAKQCPSSSVQLLQHLSDEQYIGEPLKEQAAAMALGTVQDWSDPTVSQQFAHTSHSQSTEAWSKPCMNQQSEVRSMGRPSLYFQDDVIPAKTPLNTSENACFRSQKSVDYPQTEDGNMPLDSIMYGTQNLTFPGSLSQDRFTNDTSPENSHGVLHEEGDHHDIWPMQDVTSSHTDGSNPVKSCPWPQSMARHQPAVHSETETKTEHSRSLMKVPEIKVTEEKSSCDETVKDNEEIFDAVIKDLEVALDKHNKKVREASAYVADLIANKLPLTKVEITSEAVKETWGQLFQSVNISNERIIGFCGDVPGFAKLDLDDQKILLKRAYYDIWMVTSSQFFIDGESYLQFPNGRFYDRRWMEYVIKKENVKLLFSFAESFNQLKLSELEIGIIAAIELTSPGHADLDLKDAASIQKLNSMYLDLLVYIVTKRNPDNSSRILVDIFRLLPQLAGINKMQQEVIANFSKEKPPM